MGVLQAWVGRGIGRSLLEAFEGRAQSKGLHRLELIVNCNNERAIRLYEKFGFSVSGVRKGYYIETNEDAYVMVVEDSLSNEYRLRLRSIRQELEDTFGIV